MRKSLLLVFFLCIIISGCATNVKVNEDLQLNKTMPVQIGSIENACGVDPEESNSVDLMREAISKAISDSKLPQGENGYRIDISIVEYAPGDAFKRWLMPGWGETKLSVKCNIYELDQSIGEIEVSRSIAAGGGYTVGAWKTVFDNVALSVVEELEKRTL